MILRLEFGETPDAEVGKQVLLYSGARKTCLNSDSAYRLESKRLNLECGDRVCFWYVDEGILEEMWFGVEKSLNHLRSFSGVKDVKILHELSTFNPWTIISDWTIFKNDLYDEHIGRTFLQYI
jgi:hypothetical protein